MLIVVLITGAFQLYFINDQIQKDIEKQGDIIASSIEQGIKETQVASEAIEHQIDLNLLSLSRYIGELLGDQSIDEITNDELRLIKEELGLAGISLVVHDASDDIVVAKSTDPEEVGYSLKQFPGVYENVMAILNNQLPPAAETLSYYTEGAYILPVAQSGSHEGEPVFYKYAYYHEPGTDYVIDAFIEANEMNKFTSEVGPDALIDEVNKANPYVLELAVLDPLVFEDPSLEGGLYPPNKKILYGDYTFSQERDSETLINMIKQPEQVSYNVKADGEKVYKLFIPADTGEVIYIALDYGELSGPLYRHSILLVIAGLISIVLLFVLTARFFHRVFLNIQGIKEQVQMLETGDFTARSNLKDNNEFGQLSESANKMVETLNSVLEDTNKKAHQTQRLAVLLEADAAKSVEKMYTLSMEKTAQVREQLEDFNDFLDMLEDYMKKTEPSSHGSSEEIYEKINKMREMAKNRTASTTDTTLALADLMKSLHGQSSELSNIANSLLEQMARFKL
ncbi:HAMP domain-containing protein [Gracilibacillus ureilyticus]|uniref:HAMP domain-containing protein n=2 Tax=Gracilibacillus ureilyticus TaxID=531814 RepID=A0A1H9MS82_9BACI|nr:HAMP domain-containing protein [Gracilibacillus ureilyticus]